MAIKLFKKIFILLSTFFSTQAMAQEANTTNQSLGFDYLTTVMVFVLIIAILVLVVALYLLYVVRLLVQKSQQTLAKEKGDLLTVEVQTKAEKTGWSKISASLTHAVPVEEEESILLDHNYDGIKELDNHLPPWWKGLFYFTIAFGVVYLIVYHVIKPDWAPLQDKAYAMEVQQFEEQRAQMANFIDENNVELTSLEEDLSNGRNIFISNCAACHMQDGGGGIGPNLTDSYWIHGNKIQDLFKVVKYGVAGKMVAWESTLSGKDMRDVTSYVLTNLVGSDPENPKEPEGELLEPTKVETDTTSTTPVATIAK